MKDIVELERERSIAKMAMENFGMRSTAGLSPEDRITLDVEYQRAISAYYEAESAYRSAVRFAANGLNGHLTTSVDKAKD